MRSQLCCLSPASHSSLNREGLTSAWFSDWFHFPPCLKIQGEQRCEVTAVFVFILYLGSRRAFHLHSLLPPVHQLLWTPVLRFKLSFPSHFVELAPDNERWAPISYLFMQQNGAVVLCCSPPREQHITSTGSKQLSSAGSRNIWSINQYGKNPKPLSAQSTIFCK